MKIKDFNTLLEIREQYRNEKNVTSIEMTEEQLHKLLSLFTYQQTPTEFFDGLPLNIL
jgi:hypothetical protein